MTTNTQVATVLSEVIYVPTANTKVATVSAEVFYQIRYPNTKKRHVYETT